MKWALIISIIAALSLAGSAFAEGELPPEIPEATGTVVEESPAVITEPQPEPSADGTLPEDSATLTETPPEAPPEEIILTDDLADENAAASIESGVDAPLPESEVLAEEPLADVIEDLVDLNIALTNESGEILELATVESAEALAAADPYFTVSGVIYSFTTTDCDPMLAGNQPCANPISAAINFIMNTGIIPSDRKIYVESGTYTENVVIDGTLPFLNQITGLIGKDIGSGLPTVNGSIYIHDTIMGFTLSGFTINATAGSNGAVRVNSNTGTLVLKDLTVRNTNGPGINVGNHTGAVNLTNVVSSGNFGSGALISNDNGIFPVTVNNSEFDQNNDAGGSGANNGLWIYSKGLVTLNYVSASKNDGRGVYIDTDKTVTIKNSVFNLNYSNPFYAAYGYGLWIWTGYPTNHIILENVHADNNSANGFYLLTKGNLTAKKVSAMNNTNSGASFSVDGTVSISASDFSDNGYDGLRVYGLKSITLNSITANRNTNYGVYLDNCQETSVCQGIGAVQVLGTSPNQFMDNGASGLYILASGAVTLTNFEASDNTNQGVDIRNSFTGISAGVIINANYVPLFGTFTNIIHLNGGYGLEVDSYGSISVDKVWALNNLNDGINLDNNGALTAKTVTIKNSQAWENTYSGIEISSKGSITLTNCAAYDNGDIGLDIDNTSGSGNVVVSATTIKDFSGNTNYAIEITSKGSIIVNHVDGSDTLWGTTIYNQTASSAKPLTVSDGIFSNTTNTTGLRVHSLGLITLRNITAENNASYGVYADNSTAITPQAVVINKIHLIDNDGDGIEIYSDGNVTINNLTSNSNGGMGLYIITCHYTGSACTGIGSVTLGGTWNEINGNGNSGLYISSGGNITLSNFSALYNTNSGVFAYNNYTGETGSIIISAVSGKYNEVRWNDGYGLYLASYGAVSVTRTVADDNTQNGAYITNHQALIAKNVTITDCSFSHNQSDGLYILSKGIVTLKAVTANGNSRYNSSITSGSTNHDVLSAENYMYEGGRWESWWYTGSGTVNIQLRSTQFTPQVYLYDDYGHLLAWDDNAGNLDDAFITGFSLPAAGDYRIEVTAKDGGYGIYDLALNNPIGSITNYYIYMGGLNLENTYGSADVVILPLGSKTNSFSYNTYIGAGVYSYGNISLSRAEAHYNFYDGFSLHNSSAPLAKNISILGVTANNNYYSGVYATSLGSILWNGGGASGNLTNGGTLYNDNASTPKPITVSNGEFNGNHAASGLYIYSLGSITITNVTASGNDDTWGYGLYLNNCQYSGSTCTGSGNITVTGRFKGQGYNNNGYNGIYAESFGNIRVQNTEVMGNGNTGATLYNNYSGSIGTVTVTGTTLNPADFSGNIGNDGLYINSRGAVFLTNVRSEENANGSGVVIYNYDAATPLSVTLNRVFANDNRYVGIYVESYGAINATSLQTNRNQNGGSELMNYGAPTAQPVSVTKSEFLGNQGNGLFIYSVGKVTLNNIRANENTTSGLSVDTTGDLAVLSTLGENLFNLNGNYGLYVNRAEDITLSRVTANDNSLLGMHVSSAATLIITSSNFNRNDTGGILAVLSGDAVLSSVKVINNGTVGFDHDGIYLIIISPGSTVKILNSIVTGHEGSGIDLTGASALILDGTFYYGNDTDNDGQPNVDWP